MTNENQQQNIENKLKEIKTSLINKEYEKVMRDTQEILDNDATNQEALSLLKEAHEAKTKMLRDLQSQQSKEANTSKSPEEQTTEPTKENETKKEFTFNFSPAVTGDTNQKSSEPDSPFTQSSNEPLKEKQNPTVEPTNQDKEVKIDELKPQTLEEIFTQVTKKDEQQKQNNDTNLIQETWQKPAEEKAPHSEDSKEEKSKRARKTTDIIIKVVIAAVLSVGVYYTYTLYTTPSVEEKVDMSKIQEEMPQEAAQDNEQPAVETIDETTEEKEEFFIPSSEEQKIDQSESQNILTEPKTEQKRKIRRIPLEEN